MKRFKFALSSLLDFRGYLERMARKETAIAYKNVNESQKAIDELKARYIRTAAEFDEIVYKGINAKQLQVYRNYLDVMDYGILQEKQRKKELEKKLNDQIAELIKKSVDRKVIEQLKEKKEMEYMDEFRKSEQKIIDEVVSLKKARELNYETASKK